ncbi:DUF2937 family protein [Celeribacter sp.]|uniref:DUF2937 family protein n=1 Tax=Celeribacter sp. TaxID=1890673 RepID=UPI003A956B22
MIVKTLTLVGGLLGAATVSQYPEFTQQYLQRLGGQVEALDTVIADFDRSAERAEMTREEALASLGGSVFLENRRSDMRRTIARHEKLTEDLAELRAASPMERLTMPHRVADTETARATWDDFVPAMPISVEGGISALAGFLGGYGVVAALLHFLTWPFRRGRRRKAKLQF